MKMQESSCHLNVCFQLGECVSWAGAVECVCSCGAPGLSSLQQRLGGALHLAQLRHSSVDQTEVARVQPLALKLQDMLRDKLAELAARRDHLKVCLLSSQYFFTLWIGFLSFLSSCFYRKFILSLFSFQLSRQNLF